MIKIILLAGVLSYGPALPTVLVNRQTLQVDHPLPKDLDNYDCLLGLPYGYKKFIGNEVFVKTGRHTFGPYLVVDVEARQDHPHMKNNGLASDIDCPALVHKKVELLVEVRRGLKK